MDSVNAMLVFLSKEVNRDKNTHVSLLYKDTYTTGVKFNLRQKRGVV